MRRQNCSECPGYDLLGGKIRDRIRLYWSHCATWRINHPDWYTPPITDLDGVKAIGREVREKKFTALKTNIFTYDAGRPRGWRPGSARPLRPRSMSTARCCATLRTHLEAIRDGAGPDIDILLDLNFNAKTEGYLKILRAIADLDMFWVEIDSFNPEALGAKVRTRSHPVKRCWACANSCLISASRRWMSRSSTRHGTEVWQSMKIASAAEAYEVNVAPHNFYGHLCTMMNAHFSAAVAEFADHGDRYRPVCRGITSFSLTCQRSRTAILIMRAARLGTEPNEEALRAHPPEGQCRAF